MARPRKSTRAVSRLEVRNQYDAAGRGRRMKGWNPASTGPNKALANLAMLRNRARDSVRNDWAGAASIQRWVTSLIGTGITPRLPKDFPKTRRKEVTLLWKRWVPGADADGVLDFYGLQALAVRTWLDAGEVFVRARTRRLDFGLEVPLQIQLIESEFVPVFDADSWQGMPAGHRIRSGIELDRRGQRVAYWCHREHPGDGGSVTTSTQLLRIPASEMIHIFEPLRPGQLRGVSSLAPVLTRLRNTADFDDTVLERQKIANLFTVFLTKGVGADVDLDALTGMAMEMDGDTPLAGLAPGLIQELGYGEDVKFANPPEAGTGYGEYMRTQNMGTAAGAGLPYEVMSGDIKEVSDRTLRVIINEFRRFAEQRQWHLVIPQFCQKVRHWWAETALLAGHIDESEFDAVTMVEWATHGWAHIHPVQDPQGKKLEVEAGFRSRSSVIGENGEDPDDVDEERAADMEREKELELWVDPNPQPAGAKPGQKDDGGDEDGIDNEEYAAPPNAQLMAVIQAMQAQLQVLSASLTLLTQRDIYPQAPAAQTQQTAPQE